METFREFITEGKSDKYRKDTMEYIDSLLKSADGKTKKLLQGLKKFLDENNFLTDDQRKALGNITNKVG